MCLREKICVGIALLSDVLLAMNSMYMNQQYISIEMSSNINTCKTKLCIDILMKMLSPEAHRNLTARSKQCFNNR
jgi:hypothetical protein